MGRNHNFDYFNISVQLPYGMKCTPLSKDVNVQCTGTLCKKDMFVDQHHLAFLSNTVLTLSITSTQPKLPLQSEENK